MDTQWVILTHRLPLLFLLDGAHRANERIPSFQIVPRFDVSRHRTPCLVAGVPVVFYNQLKLQRRKEALRDGAVVAIALATYAGANAVRRELRAKHREDIDCRDPSGP